MRGWYLNTKKVGVHSLIEVVTIESTSGQWSNSPANMDKYNQLIGHAPHILNQQPRHCPAFTSSFNGQIPGLERGSTVQSNGYMYIYIIQLSFWNEYSNSLCWKSHSFIAESNILFTLHSTYLDGQLPFFGELSCSPLRRLGSATARASMAPVPNVFKFKWQTNAQYIYLSLCLSIYPCMHLIYLDIYKIYMIYIIIDTYCTVCWWYKIRLWYVL